VFFILDHGFVTAVKVYQKLVLMCESMWINGRECFPTVSMCWI